MKNTKWRFEEHVGFCESKDVIGYLPSGFYSVNSYGDLYGLSKLEDTSDDLIEVDDPVILSLCSDIDLFMRERDLIKSYGFTHKRGYLLFGPPGTGKSSLAKIFGRKIIKRHDGVMVRVSSSFDLQCSTRMLSDIEPERIKVYLIDDGDDFINDADSLAVFDGSTNVENAIFIVTTNWTGNLPPRIANRPGRFDRVTLIDRPSKEVQRVYFEQICARNVEMTDRIKCDRNIDSIPASLVEGLDGLSITIAHLKEAFISFAIFGENIETIRDRFAKMAELTRSDQD